MVMKLTIRPTRFHKRSTPRLFRDLYLWLLGQHRVYAVQRSRDILSKAIGQMTARTCLADPPYNVAIQGMLGAGVSTKHREFAMASGEMTEPEYTFSCPRRLPRSVVRAGRRHYVTCLQPIANIFVNFRQLPRHLH